MAEKTNAKAVNKKQPQAGTKIKKPMLYKVIMHNDDFTPMDFVVEMLEKYFAKSHDEAMELMLTVHHGGKAVVGIYPYDIALTKQSRVIGEARSRKHPFSLSVEPVEE